MTVTIFSANIGKIDYPQTIADQIHSHYYKCFKDPVDGKSHRLSSKFYKTFGLTHYRPQCDIAIWLDHRVDVISPDFIGFVLEQMQGKNIVIPKHPERETIGEEYYYILQNIDKPYLKQRYEGEDFEAERTAYGNSLDAVLVNPRFFAIDLRKKASRELLENWWWEINTHTIFDQCSISYLLHNAKKNLKWSTVEWSELDKHLKVNKHK